MKNFEQLPNLKIQQAISLHQDLDFVYDVN